METELLFSEEGFSFEKELLDVERMSNRYQSSPLTLEEALTDGLESYDICYNFIYDDEEIINTQMFDDSSKSQERNQMNYFQSSVWAQPPTIQSNSITTDSYDMLHEIDESSELKVKEDEQKTACIKEKTTSETNGNNKMTMDIKFKTEQETENEKLPSNNNLSVSSREINQSNISTKKKSQNAKGKRKKKENSVTIINEKVKLEEQEDCIDVETIPRDEVPVLEAVDVKSLLEQFEASENSSTRSKSTIKNNRTYNTKSNKLCQITQEHRTNVTEKAVFQPSTQQKDVHTSLSKDIIDKIKASARKKTISIIPAMPNICNNARMQNKVPRNKISKKKSTVTNNVKSETLSSSTSIQLDHDYCSSANFHVKNGSKTAENTSILKLSQNKNRSVFKRCHISNLYSNTLCEPIRISTEVTSNSSEDNRKDCQKETLLKQSYDSNSSSIKNKSSNESTVASLRHEIRSSLAKKILRLNGVPKTNIVQTNPKPQYMISVLKNPPNASQSPSSTNNSNENIVTTTDSLNNEVQNIIVHNTQNTLPHNETKVDPPRKKLNLAEYLNRKNKSETIPKIKSKTVLVYAYHATTMTELVIKDDPNNPEIWCDREMVPVLKEKSQIKEEQNKPKPPTRDVGIQTIETLFEFSTSTMEMDVVEENEKREESLNNEEEKKFCKKLSRSRSRSESKSRGRSKDRRKSRSHSKSKSRSRSKTRSRSRNRNTNTRNRSRSRSRSPRCSNTRRRTISHRRSSVSSSSSWTSRSLISTRSRYSYSRSRSRSRNRSRPRNRSRYHGRSHSRNRSRSHDRSRSRNRSRSRDRSRSRTRSRSKSRSSRRYYSSSSRSSSTSNFGRNKWSSHRRRDSSDRERNYDRYERYPFGRDYKSCSRSPPYHKSYDNWHNKEKQREVEERRVIYVGRLDEGITKTDLRRRFEVFGPVVDISVHFRERGDNYGFVTFLYNKDAYRAVEHGNDNPSLPRYDLCFGGRRAFCKSKYADLDDIRNNTPLSRLPLRNEANTFDYLLKEAKAQLHKRRV